MEMHVLTFSLKGCRLGKSRLCWHLCIFLLFFFLCHRSHVSDLTEYSYPATPNHSLHQHPMTPTYVGSGDSLHHVGANQVHEHDFRSSTGTLRHGTLNRPQQPPPPPPPTMDGLHPPPLVSSECR